MGVPRRRGAGAAASNRHSHTVKLYTTEAAQLHAQRAEQERSEQQSREVRVHVAKRSIEMKVMLRKNGVVPPPGQARPRERMVDAGCCCSREREGVENEKAMQAMSAVSPASVAHRHLRQRQ